MQVQIHVKCKSEILYVLSILLILTQGYIYWFWRKRKGERNIDVRQKHWSVASHICPIQGSKPQPKYVPWLGIEPATLVYRMVVQPLSCLAGALLFVSWSTCSFGAGMFWWSCHCNFTTGKDLCYSSLMKCLCRWLRSVKSLLTSELEGTLW